MQQTEYQITETLEYNNFCKEFTFAATAAIMPPHSVSKTDGDAGLSIEMPNLVTLPP